MSKDGYDLEIPTKNGVVIATGSLMALEELDKKLDKAQIEREARIKELWDCLGWLNVATPKTAKEKIKARLAELEKE